LQRTAFYCLYSLAGEPPRAFAVINTRTSAKVPVGTIVYAGIFRTSNTLAVVIGRARSAEVGIAGDADVDHVGVSTCHLVAGPTGGTFFLTSLGADSFPEMLHTPSRLAVLVIVALVEEAAFTRVALKRLSVSRIRRCLRLLDVQNIRGPGTCIGEKYFPLLDLVDVGLADIGRSGGGSAASQGHQ